MTATALLAQIDLAQAEIDSASRRLQNLREALQGGNVRVAKNPAMEAFASARRSAGVATEILERIERPTAAGKARK